MMVRVIFCSVRSTCYLKKGRTIDCDQPVGDPYCREILSRVTMRGQKIQSETRPGVKSSSEILLNRIKRRRGERNAMDTALRTIVFLCESSTRRVIAHDVYCSSCRYTRTTTITTRVAMSERSRDSDVLYVHVVLSLFVIRERLGASVRREIIFRWQSLCPRTPGLLG